jgi:uncharacterized protein (TIGR03437 family)
VAEVVVQSGGVIKAGQLNLWSGTMTVQNTGTLNMTGAASTIQIGDHTTVLNFSGTGQLTGQLIYIHLYPQATLEVTNNDSISMTGVVDLAPTAQIKVLSGALNIGVAPSAGQGWITVGVGGVLFGGAICTMSSTENPCVVNSLVDLIGRVFVMGSVSNRGGLVIQDPATLDISQNFQQTAGTLDVQIGGNQPGQYDQIAVGGSIQITGGTVQFDFVNGFAPSSGDNFNLLSAPGGISTSGASFTTSGLGSGFNYTTSVSNGQFDLTASNSGTATTTAPPPPPTPTLTSLDAASGATELAPGSLASAYGTNLATGQPITAPFPWPSTLGGTSVTIVDELGNSVQAPLLYVSPTLVNYEIPFTVALGLATVTVTAGDGTMSSGPINVVPFAPGIFEVNSAGMSASFADCVAADGAQTTILTSQVVNGAVVAVPLNLGMCRQTILELWTTGLDGASASNVQATIGGQSATVLYAGPQGVYPGVDQVNVVIPQSLAGAGNVPVVLTAGEVASNTVNVTIQ